MALLLLGLLPMGAWAGQIMEHKGIAIGTPDGQGCGRSMTVTLAADSLDDFHRSRIDMQEVARISRAYIGLDCDELEALSFDGRVDGEPVYQAESRARDGWALEESDPPAEPTKNQNAAPEPAPETAPSVAAGAQPEPQPTSAQAASDPPAVPDDETATNAATYADRAELEQKAQAGDAQAQLDLARAQLDLPEAPPGVEVTADVSAGIAQLESLVKAGNAEAMHALAQAYLKHPEVPVNEALIQQATQVAPTPGDRLRGMASALLTLKAAEQGSPNAIGAMNDAGRAGSADSYYALGTMYMLDRRSRMPRSRGFLRKRLKVRRKLSGRGNVDVGLHFMRLAASAGHAAAAAMLSDLGEPFDAPSSGSAGGATASASAAGSAAATGSASAAGTAANLVEQGQAAGQGASVLSASVFSQVLEPGSSSSSSSSSGGATQTAQGGSAGRTSSRANRSVAQANPSGGTGAPGATGPGAPGPRSTSTGTARVQSTSRSGGSRVRHDDTIMDSEEGEAEIID
ncbi:MAG: hypothetical protein AAGI15_12565 [Pseudomonadota bacterium]